MTEPTHAPSAGHPTYGYPPQQPPPPRPTAPPNYARTLLVMLLACAGALVTAIAPATLWARATLLDTDRYVATMTPLAADPGVQHLVITAVDDRIDAFLSSGQFSPGATADAVNTVVTRVVTSSAFPALWTQMNRLAHPEIVSALTGRASGTGTVQTSGDQVDLNLAPVITYVVQQLGRIGVVFGDLPANSFSSAYVTVADVPQLGIVQGLVRLVDDVAPALPWLALLLFAGALALARKRWRVLQVSGGLVAVAMLVGFVVLAGTKALFVDRITTNIDTATAQHVFDSITRGLRADLWHVLVGALLVAAVAGVAELFLRRRPASRGEGLPGGLVG